jgi:hypothetical protein
MGLTGFAACWRLRIKSKVRSDGGWWLVNSDGGRSKNSRAHDIRFSLV